MGGGVMTAVIPSTDEVIGRLIRQIGEYGTTMSITGYGHGSVVSIHGLDPERYPLHNAHDLTADIAIMPNKTTGKHWLTVSRPELLRALQDTAAILAFPPDTTLGARTVLKSIEGGA